MSKRDRVNKEDYKDHPFWREDLGEPHNPLYGCWCAVCSGFMCGCPCHRIQSSASTETKVETDGN